MAPQAFTALKATLKAVARCTTVSRFVRGYALASYVRVSYSMIADLNMNARCAVTRRVPSRLIAVALQTVSIGRCDILSVHLSQLNLFTEVGDNNLGRTSVRWLSTTSFLSATSIFVRHPPNIFVRHHKVTAPRLSATPVSNRGITASNSHPCSCPAS